MWLGFVSVLLVGCAGSAKPVRSVAEYDLSCGNVEVNRIDDERYAAYGCGRGAMYVQSCDGSGCRWARMRHGHEAEVAGAAPVPALRTPAPREVQAAPPLPSREVTPAPAPQQREVLPAPAPSSSATPATSGGEAPALGQQTTPLTQGELSDPYDSEVPAQPVAQQVADAPPEPLVETRPAAPRVTYVWVGGYWWWNSPAWVWVPGYWCPPRPGFVYIGSYWYWSSGWWWYYPGGFGYPGTTTVVYAPAPRTQRVATVRTFRPHRTVHSTPARVDNSPRTVTSSGSSFRPTASPLTRYPSAHASARNVTAQRAPSASSHQVMQRPNGGIGRVVRPQEARTRFSAPSRAVTSSGPRFDRGAGPRVDRSNVVRPESTRVPTSRNVRPAAPSSAPRAPRSFDHKGGGGSPRVVRPR
jgi:hypothetical protein